MSGTGSHPPEGEHERPALREYPNPASETGPVWVRRRDRVLGWLFTAGAHLALIAIWLWPHTPRPHSPVEPPLPPIQVSLLSSPKPPGPVSPQTGGHDDAPEPTLIQPAKPVVTLPVVNVAVVDNSDLLSASQIAGAASAGDDGAGGGGGGSCDMARAVQKALRRDPLVRAAVEDANRLGKSVMLWNGDWVRSGGQEGKGLSAVREAIMWEVAFVPATCRNQRMHGLVLLSLEDGATRFAIGSDEWRWSDLLGVRSTSR